MEKNMGIDLKIQNCKKRETYYSATIVYFVISWGIPRQIEPDFRIFCTTICDFDETWSIGYF